MLEAALEVIFYKIVMGRTYLCVKNSEKLKNSGGRSPLTDGCLLRFDWSRPIDAESGRGKELGRSENKRPETRRSWSLNQFQDPIEKKREKKFE
ncbi:hypothetical protein TNCV_1003641 [Trichonephila clavipes]|nr:hypothetical protein TNCV_1003641 [Trichonephila clavipes]